MDDFDWPREKKWRHLYTRSVKIRRAQQLGFEYPRLTEQERLETELLNVLFVCTMNKWRSPTAEKIYAGHPLLNVRSAGTSSKAQRSVSVSDIRWCDVIVLMEEKHSERIRAEFRENWKVVSYMCWASRIDFDLWIRNSSKNFRRTLIRSY